MTKLIVWKAIKILERNYQKLSTLLNRRTNQSITFQPNVFFLLSLQIKSHYFRITELRFRNIPFGIYNRIDAMKIIFDYLRIRTANTNNKHDTYLRSTTNENIENHFGNSIWNKTPKRCYDQNDFLTLSLLWFKHFSDFTRVYSCEEWWFTCCFWEMEWKENEIWLCCFSFQRNMLIRFEEWKFRTNYIRRAQIAKKIGMSICDWTKDERNGCLRN